MLRNIRSIGAALEIRQTIAGAGVASENRFSIFRSCSRRRLMSDDFIPISKPAIGAREKELVLEALESGWVSSLGKYIDKFEREFSSYCGSEFALTVSSGTAGLHLALTALGIGSGDEVIVPDLTFVATPNAVAYTGARP